MRPPQRLHQQGLSLIEMMIALVLGLLITAALFQAYLSASQSQRVQDALASRQESLRFANLLLSRDIRMAGYRDCLSDPKLIVNVLNDPGHFLYDFSRHIDGFDAQGTAWLPALHASLQDQTIEPGSDVLTVRTVLGDDVVLISGMPNTSAALKIKEKLKKKPFKEGGGDLALLADCGAATVFQVTNYNHDSGTVVHNAGVSKKPGNSTKSLGKQFGPGTKLMKISTVNYFIRQSPSGHGPSLWRRLADEPAEELVDGIETLQLRYGEDTDGDGVPDQFRTADKVVDWLNIKIVQIGLLARSIDAVGDADPRVYTVLGQSFGPYADGRLRRVMEFNVAIRNQLL